MGFLVRIRTQAPLASWRHGVMAFRCWRTRRGAKPFGALGPLPGSLSEVVAQVRDELGVARMVHCFEADDPLRQGVLVLLHEPEEVQLRLRRADDQDLMVSLERLRDL